MSDSGKAVFLSYASQDAEAARRICDALRQAGVEVWFDQSELRGGDAWDAKIRRQIKECALFVPIISANTNARPEGYFRLEWHLAEQRTYLMAHDQPFLFPVVIDDTTDATARVPEKFRDVQWTRLSVKDTPETLAVRVGKLLGGGPPEARGQGSEVGGQKPGDRSDRSKSQHTWLRYGWAAVGIVFALVYAVRPLFQAERRAEPKAAVTVTIPDPKPQTPNLSQARQLEARARALIDDDPLAVRENYHTAYELCERAVTLSPDDGEIWATLARAHCVLIANYNENSDRQVALARSQAERAMRLAPQSIESGLAMAHFEGLTNAGLAAVRLRGLQEKAPTDRRILQELVRVEEDEKNPDAGTSRRWAEQASALPGGDAKALVNLAWVYWGLNQYPELEATLERSLAIQPTSGAYHLKLMVLTVHGSLTGDQTAARAWLQQIPPAILREDRVAMIANQTLYFARQPEAALKVLAGIPREILEEGRYFAPRGYLAGEALLMAGKPRAAEVEFRAALKVIEARLALDASNSRLVFSKGRILARLGDRDGAARLFETARELGISSAMNMESLMLEGRNDDVIKAADALMVRSRSRWPAMLGGLKANPIYDPLRTDPRFQLILARGEAWMQEMYHPADAPKSTQYPTPASALPARPEPAERAPSGQPPPDAKSVAVLAFANLSDDKANEYFSDGISEELLNVLAKIPGLKVTARTSAFHFKGKDTPIPEIAKQLGVAYVVEGSVRKAGDKVRITAQLIKAADGFHVWSDTFTRDLKDIFAVQDEIAGLIAKNLQLKLGETGVKAALDPAIYELLLEARAMTMRESNEDWRRAITLYRRAVEREPSLALAWAEMARTYVQLGRFGGMSIAEGMREARSAAQRSLELEPDQATGLVALGWVQRTADWDWRGARSSFQRARELAPGNSSIMGDLAVFYFNTGRVAEAQALARQAVERDPLNARAQAGLGFILNISGEWEQALVPLAQAVALAPAIEEVRSHIARSLVMLGRTDEAAAAAKQEPNEAYRLAGLSYLGRQPEQAAASSRAFAEFIDKYGDEMPTYVAMIYAVRGEVEPAFVWFKRAMNRRDAGVAWMKTNVYCRSLHADPRWPAMLRKVGLTDDQLK